MKKSKLLSLFISISLALCSFGSIAKMSLDKTQSSINFISTKNEHIAEQHTFENFSGTIDNESKLTITIDISSVNTMIPIRNERMLSMFFEASNYATATFTAQIDPSSLKIQPGEAKRTSVTGDMIIAGNTAPVSFDVILTGLKNGSVNASTVKPTILSTSAFDLDDGLAALQNIAKLKSISKAVPLSFSVTFTQLKAK